LKHARAIVLQHHERWDGGGYPNGLVGEGIVLGARIFAVADALDAILSDRPYRAARDIDTAIAEIEACAHSQFDPNVVQAFSSIPKAKWLEIRILHPDEPRLLR
jgi:HD-GYP domain-containing protein (c-di-GMP phosphodiesterase class II)